MKTILIHACRLAHVGERFKDTQNIAFLISGKNKSIFHSGDTDHFQTDKYTGHEKKEYRTICQNGKSRNVLLLQNVSNHPKTKK
jgi:L-ascorbate metabolism protein UlaG (beta-lactamase superfamily)